MKGIVREKKNEGLIELLIDTSIFSKDIVFNTVYNFLDRGYFFFYLESERDLIVQYRPKKGKELDEFVLPEFYDSLLEFMLRDTLEQKNQVIREAIVLKAINGPFDLENFVSLDTDISGAGGRDFKKSLDEIIAEIDQNGDLDISEDEINSILDEMKIDPHQDILKPDILVDPRNISSAKNIFTK